MMDSFKILKADVDKLQDAKIDLARLIEDMDDILAPRMLQQFKKVVTKIRMGLADVNKQKELQWEARYNYIKNQEF
jgi:hypothetical protein